MENPFPFFFRFSIPDRGNKRSNCDDLGHNRSGSVAKSSFASRWCSPSYINTILNTWNCWWSRENDVSLFFSIYCSLDGCWWSWENDGSFLFCFMSIALLFYSNAFSRLNIIEREYLGSNAFRKRSLILFFPFSFSSIFFLHRIFNLIFFPFPFFIFYFFTVSSSVKV